MREIDIYCQFDTKTGITYIGADNRWSLYDGRED